MPALVFAKAVKQKHICLSFEADLDGQTSTFICTVPWASEPSIRFCNTCSQARSQVLRLGGQNTHWRGKYFCFYNMFKTKFSGHNQILGGTNKIGGNCPEGPRGYGPVRTLKRASALQGVVLVKKMNGQSSPVWATVTPSPRLQLMKPCLN